MLYVASSWKNPYYNNVVDKLRAHGFECFDFRRPDGDGGFHWSNIDKNWRTWSLHRYRQALRSYEAGRGFHQDMHALKACDALVLVMPCGRSAHLELGYAIGQSKPSFVYFPKSITEDEWEPELMYKAAVAICVGMDELTNALRAILATPGHAGAPTAAPASGQDQYPLGQP